METKDLSKTAVRERIRFIIDDKFKKTITEFANTTGIGRTTVSNILNPKPNKKGEKVEVSPTLDTLQKIVGCKEININPEWLLLGVGLPYKGDESELKIKELEAEIDKLKDEISKYTKKGMDVMVDNERLRQENVELKRLLETIKVDPKMESA